MKAFEDHDPDSEYLGLKLNRNKDGRIMLPGLHGTTVLAKAGDEVRFLATGGWDGEQEWARKHFNKGDVHKVTRVSVGMSSSKYYFEGVSGSWNTVMFERVE